MGASMFVQGMAQMFFRGTPFFMLLSGYLLINKAFDNKYYHRGKKVIISYLFFFISYYPVSGAIYGRKLHGDAMGHEDP